MNNPFRTSSYSGTGGGTCVEVGARNGVLVRDSTDRGGQMLAFTPDAWGAFLNALK